MRTAPCTLLFLTGALLLGTAPAGAQEIERLGVEDALRMAEAGSPRLGEIRAQLDRKSGELLEAPGIEAPGLVYLREGIPGGRGYAEQRWGLSQTIQSPLLSYYRVRRTRTEADALRLVLEAETARVRAGVKRAYTELLYAQELLHLRDEEVELNRQLLEAATLRVRVGEASELEQMKAEIGLAEAESDLAEAGLRFEHARYALFHAVGLDPEAQRYEIVFPDTLAYFDARIDQARVLARIETGPELQSAARAAEASRLGIRQIRSSLVPALSVDLYPQDYGDGYRRYGFQIGLKLPLPFLPAYRGRLQAARAALREDEWRRTTVRLDLKRQAEDAWHGYVTSRQIITRYQTRVHDRAAELLGRTLEGYRIGEVSLVTLLDAERTYRAGQLRFYDALRAYYLDLIELERFLGEEIVFRSSPDGLAREGR